MLTRSHALPIEIISWPPTLMVGCGAAKAQSRYCRTASKNAAARSGGIDFCSAMTRATNGLFRHFFERNQRFGQGLTAIDDEGLIGCEEQYRISDIFNRP